MNEQEHTNYQRIEAVIKYLQTSGEDQINLENLAQKFHSSTLEFQQLFTDWAGIKPKQFLQFTSCQYAKTLLNQNHPTLFETTTKITPFSSNSPQHSFVTIESMTPSELENGGKNLSINYSFANSNFGTILLAATSKGICYIAFADDKTQALSLLKQHFPNANFTSQLDALQQNAVLFFNHKSHQLHPINLHLKGTEFQFKVWESLLNIPLGQLTTYGQLAQQIGKPKAARAVGTAIGDNPIAFLIPCHRVIQASGKLGGYMWGTARKAMMIAWEAAKINRELTLDL